MLCSQRDGKPDRQCYEMILETMAEAVLIVDSEMTIQFCNQAAVELSGYGTRELVEKSCKELLDCGTGESSECNIFQSGEISGLECLLRKKNGKKLPVLRNARLMKTAKGKAIGAVETLTDISQLKKTEKKLENLQLSLKERYRCQNIVGKSQSMQELFRLIDLAAASQSTILITGESGTGKELIAEAIHDKSPRKNRSLVKVNCSVLSETLLESELFGHVKGAFTGAIKDKPGRFELAHNGTLFLDEIGEISPLVQLKLLRFLQEKEFERVGESRTRRANVRILSATNKDLYSLVKEGRFREDLYYRLKVFTLHAPSLRERKEDVGVLIEHFIGIFNTETGKAITGVDHDAMVMLMDYLWPGNVRELEHAIEHAFVTCRGGEIGIFDLPVEIRRNRYQRETSPLPSLSTQVMQDHFTEAKQLRELLERFHWNKSLVAKHLKVNRTTVWRMMKRLGI